MQKITHMSSDVLILPSMSCGVEPAVVFFFSLLRRIGYVRSGKMQREDAGTSQAVLGDSFRLRSQASLISLDFLL